MKIKLVFTILLLISLHSFSQEKELPKGWDIITLDGKTAYMNLITGDVLTTFPKKPALKVPKKMEYDPTIIHTVKKGETLSKIGRKYHKSLVDMYRLNNMESFDKIKIGQEIIVGYNEGGKKSVNEKYKKTSNKYHTVIGGETLYRIANKYNLTVQKLKELNDLKSNVIFVGKELIIN